MTKASFMQIILSAVKLLVVVGAFFLFGYLELQYRCGFVVAILVGVYLFRAGSRIVPSLLVIGNVVASYYALKPLVVLSFLALNCALFFTDHKPADDTKVVLRPYESEVRNILFRHDPSLLHTVDSMLDEHEGREKELIYKLNAQYDGTPRKTPSKASVGSAKKVEPTPIRFENPPSDIPPVATSRGNEGNWRSPSVLSPVANSADANTLTIVKQIKNILRVKDPSLFKSVDRMLQEYQGRESDLLQEVQDEYMCDQNDSNVSASYEAGHRYPSHPSQNYSQHTSPSQQHYTRNNYDNTTNCEQDQSYSSTTDSWERPTQNFRTLDGRPAVVSVERGFSSPYSQYSSAPTPLDMHSVESLRREGGRLPPFSPQARVVSNSMKGSPRGGYSASATNYNSSDSNRAYREELVQAPYNNDDTPRYHPSPSSHTNNTTDTTYMNTQAYRNSVIQQAQEDARREMEARIEARWGGKGSSAHASKSSSGVQKRQGYSYND